MEEKRLKKIEERVAKATPGPWGVGGPTTERPPYDYQVVGPPQPPETGPRRCPCCGVVSERTDPPESMLIAETNGSEGIDAEANAEFIVSARQDVPDLVAEVRRLRGLLAEVAAHGLEERAPGREDTDLLLRLDEFRHTRKP